MLKLEIRTIESLIFDSAITSVSFFSEEGYVTIYEGHEDIVLQVKPGEIEVNSEDSSSTFFVLDGIVKIQNGEKIIMLVNELESSENISKELVQEAINRAEKTLEAAEDSDEYTAYEYEVLKAQLVKELAKGSSVQ